MKANGIAIVLVAAFLGLVIAMTSADAAVARLDGTGTVFYGGPGTFGSWAGGPPANINDGVWDDGSNVRVYTGFGSGAAANYIGYSWATPQSVTDIVYVDGSGQNESAVGQQVAGSFSIEWSAGGVGAPSTWSWTSLATYSTGPRTPHLSVNLSNVRGVRVLSNAPLGQYIQMPELAVYGGGGGGATIPVQQVGFSTANSTNPGSFTEFSPGNLVNPNTTRTYWARYQPSSPIPTGGGPEATWKGSWSTPQNLGGIVLWGDDAGGYYPSVVETHKLYTLNPGKLVTSTDYVNDWTLWSASASRLNNGSGVQILFPSTVTTQAVALLQTGEPNLVWTTFSLYGGHMVILSGEEPVLIPEPASLALIGLGLCSLTLLRQKR